MLSTQPRNDGNEDDSNDYVLDEHNTCAQTLVDINAFYTMEIRTILTAFDIFRIVF